MRCSQNMIKRTIYETCNDTIPEHISTVVYVYARFVCYYCCYYCQCTAATAAAAAAARWSIAHEEGEPHSAACPCNDFGYPNDDVPVRLVFCFHLRIPTADLSGDALIAGNWRKNKTKTSSQFTLRHLRRLSLRLL